jgi:hypothetical protein
MSAPDASSDCGDPSPAWYVAQGAYHRAGVVASFRTPRHVQIDYGTGRQVGIVRHAHAYDNTTIVATALDQNPRLCTTPSTPTTTSGGGVTSPANDEATTTRSERRSKARSVHHRWDRAAGGALGSYYCGSSPFFRIYPPAIYGYAAPAPVVVAPAYRGSSLWWPGYYDYAPGNWGRGHPRYGGYGRRAGYHGD